MARANLSLSKDVTDLFISAQDNLSIRTIQVRIEEEEMVIGEVLNRFGSVEKDFEEILPESLNGAHASLVLFRLTEDSASNWLLIAWVPDGCRVRDKMLYTSSREDLKRTLGLGYFKAEYAANVKEDLTWSQLQAHLNDEGKAIYSASEILIKEEKILSLSESHATKSAAMSVLPLNVPAESQDSLQEFTLGTFNMLEIQVENESVIVSNKITVNQNEVKFQDLIDGIDSRFYVLSLTKSAGDLATIFIYSCPENVPIKTKMVMASFKSSVLGILKDVGVIPDKTIEIRGADEIDDIIKGEIDPQVSIQTPAMGTLSHAKPTRPGRASKAKVAKFVGDDV